jgi:hypothetical protein
MLLSKPMKALTTFTIALGFLAIGGSPPATANSFGAFAGTWSGSGTITVQNGSRERLRCRGNFRPGGGGASLSLNLRCASDSYKFEFQSEVTSDGGNLSGTWNEVTRSVYGSVTGRIAGNRIDASAVAAGFTAAISLRASGNSQQVSIRAPGSEISDVSISLARGGR